VKKITAVLSAAILAMSLYPSFVDAGGRGGGRSSGGYSSKGYSPRSYSPRIYSPKVDSWNYKSTGLPKTNRSKSAKDKFLRGQGYKNVPQGYEINHITPLHKGGADSPYNMQLLPKELHQQKTNSER
jgi:hypothetical protein